jgi:hypothetical protein
MATTTYHEYTGNASTTEFVYSFEPIKIEDVKVALNGVTQTTGYTASLSPAKVMFTSAPASGVVVRVYRDTDVDSAKGVYAAGSSIRAVDLNNNQDQVLYALQEEQNQKGIFESISLDDDVKIKLGNSDDFTLKWDPSNDGSGWTSPFAEIKADGLLSILSSNIQRFYIGSDLDGHADDLVVQFASGAINLYKPTSVTGDLSPVGDDTYSLGTQFQEWKNLYIDGTAYLDSVDIDAGAIDGTTIGGSSPAAGTFTNGTIATADINGGAIDGTTIGASSASTGAFTTLTTSGNVTISGHATTTSLQVNSTVASHLIPSAHANYNLGATNVRWGNAYVNTANVNDITGGAVITTGTSTSDTKVYSAKRCDELYYNLASAEEIQSGETWVAADNKVATTAAIDARIVDLVDDVGGFVPIANETSFPNANPDVNNGAGTLVSVPLANSLTASTAIITIANGTVGNSTVTIIGCDSDSATYAAGFGIIVETTATLNTYKFHRYVPKATEVTTVATNIANINAAVSNQTNINAAVSNASNINTVAGIASNVTTVAGISSDVTAVAGDAADIGACSTNIGSIAAIGSDLAGNFENITDHGSITGAVTSTSGTSDISTVANSIANVNTVAGISSNVTTVAGDTTAINNITTNLTAVQNAATNATNAASSATAAASSATAAASSATSAATSATTATTQATTATTQASTATTQATNSATSASTASTQATNAGNSATTATTQASNASTSAANALAYKNLALTYRNDASAILTQVESAPYNLSDSASTHTAWGNITDTGANAVFTNESSNTLLTMAEGSSSYNYGSIT